MGLMVRGVILLGALFLASCQTLFINLPTITQLVPDPPLFMVSFPLRNTINDGQHEIVVPVGFITDLASIPSVLWWWESPHEGTMAPAIIHDFLYWEQSCSKDEADAVMYLAMLEVGLGNFTTNRIYDGIRTSFAQDAWDKNSAARERGETRFFTKAYARTLQDSRIDPKATLVSLQRQAAESRGLYKPRSPNSKVKTACAAALKEFNTL